MTNATVSVPAPTGWRSLYPVHPCADVFPMMTDVELEALAEDITTHGLKKPVTMWRFTEESQVFVLDGRNRLAALERLGATFSPLRRGGLLSQVRMPDGKTRDFGQFVCCDDPAAFVISANIRRRHLTKQQQAELILKAIEAGNIEIDSATVARSFNPTPLKKGGSTKDPVLAKAVTLAQKVRISKRTVQISRAKLQGKTPAAPKKKKIGVSPTPPPSTAKPLALKRETDGPSKSSLEVHFSRESVEHYTPQSILDAVIACLGGIDLDPCSNSADTPHVPAKVHFTKADDGLSKVWTGRVFMNPPYGREIQQWVDKLVKAHRQHYVTAAIALVPARSDTEWWRALRDYWCCFIAGRLTFGGNEDPAPFPSAVYYLGRKRRAFLQTFSKLGDVWYRVR